MRGPLAIALLGIGAALGAAALPLLDVPPEHLAYDLVERLEVRAGLGRTFLDTRPLTRGELAELVRRLGDAARAGTWTPTGIEAQQLALLRAEFSEELTAAGDSVPLLQRAWHVWSRPGWRLQAFWQGRQLVERGSREGWPDLPQTDARLVLQPAAALQIGAHFVAWEQVDYRVRTGDGFFRQDIGSDDVEYVFDSGDRFTIVRSDRPMLRFGMGRWRVDLGRQRLRWGPGRHNAMLLQETVPPFDRLALHVDFGPVRFTSLAAQLRSRALLPADPDLGEKYLAAHRIEIAAHRRLTVALSEALVYGDRGLDLSYVNPLTVLFVAQSNNGDRDNALASVDARLLAADGLELYGELVLDDLNLRRGLRHFGNKPAVLAGLLWTQPFGARDWDFEAEWSWASQYVYTHHIPINRYQHFSAGLGSRTGPDADLWVVGARRFLSRSWSARGFYTLERHGEGSLGLDHETRSSDQQEFLSGVVESRHRPGLEVRYRGLRSLDLRMEYRFAAVVHAGHVAAQRRLDTHELAAELRFEF